MPSINGKPPRIAGVDEAGRGPLAGPVVAAAIILPRHYCCKGIDDSKKLSPEKREVVFEKLIIKAHSWAIVAVGHRRIDHINIREATRLAMKLAVQKVNADSILIDGNMTIDITIPQKTIIGGDGSVTCIAAASILAKVWRDRLMRKLAARYPGYGFEEHAGYGTKAHREAIGRLGPSRVHRRTFHGIKEFYIEDCIASPEAA